MLTTKLLLTTVVEFSLLLLLLIALARFIYVVLRAGVVRFIRRAGKALPSSDSNDRRLQYEPPRGVGLSWLPDPKYRLFSDPQRPPKTFDRGW
jgi:hypothetical protein